MDAHSRNRLPYAAAAGVALALVLAAAYWMRPKPRPAPARIDVSDREGRAPTAEIDPPASSEKSDSPVARGAVAATAEVESPDLLAATERVALVLLFTGSLEVNGSALAVDWSETSFELRGIERHAVWVGLALHSEVRSNGEFRVSAECRRKPEIAEYTDDEVIQTMTGWMAMDLTIRHPLLQETHVEVPLEPWPRGMVAGAVRELTVGLIGLDAASGIRGRVTWNGAPPPEKCGVGLFVLEEEKLPPAANDFRFCDPAGGFFLHHSGGGRALVVASVPSLAPAWALAEFETGLVTQVGELALQQGVSLRGRVQLSADATISEGAYVEVNGFSPNLQNTRTRTWQLVDLAMHTLERFCWDGERMIRSTCRTALNADGSFELGGLAPMCYRMRANATSGQFDLTQTNDAAWTTVCAPADEVLLRRPSSMIRVRIVSAAPEAKDTCATIGWVDDQGDHQENRIRIRGGLLLETFPHQAVDVRIDADPAGRIHTITAPAIGLEATYEIDW